MSTAATAPRMFPILGGKNLKAIPWALLEPHRAQAAANHNQSLERLAERGGLAAQEAWAAIIGINLLHLHKASWPTSEDAELWLQQRVIYRDGWNRECADTDALLRMLALDPQQCRTAGGSLHMPRILTLLTPAARDVLTERVRQVSTEGHTPEHDDEHVNEEIAAMAAFYAMPDGARDWPATETGYGDTLGEAIRPEGWEGKTGDRRQELVKAGALIMAEIERLDRAAGAAKGASRG